MARVLSVLAVFVFATVVVAQEAKPPAPKAGPPAKAEPPTKAEPAAAPKTTLECLQAAYNGESNAKARYLEFAKKADEEGFAGAAVLFRAAAKAEEVHANNHAEIIKKLGGTPKADLQKPEVKSTKENLATAVKGETYENETMYPDFMKIAQAENNKDAVRAFNSAKSAEGEHAKLYKEAHDNLDQWKAKKDFFVCLVCGNVVTKVDFAKCPICFAPKEKYEQVK